jgi:hypothetical protein
LIETFKNKKSRVISGPALGLSKFEKDSWEFNSPLILNHRGDWRQSDARRGDATKGILLTPKPKPTIKSSKQSFSFISPHLSI